MQIFSNRLEKVIDLQAGGNKKKYSQISGIPYSTLIEYTKGIKKDPKLSMLVKIKNVNAEWLVYGIGDPLSNQDISPNEQIETLISEISKHDDRIHMLELKIDTMNMLLLKQNAETAKK